MALYPVILCGGSGTRLWPSSRADRPKQFLKFWGGRSTFQETLLRVRDLGGESPVIVTGEAMLGFVQDQAAELNIEIVVLVEPSARDSAPAVAAAAAYVEGRDPEAVVLMLAADHHVKDIAGFTASARIAAQAAGRGLIATFGIRPDNPATGFGYIQPGEAVMEGVFQVARFVEKPDLATAERYVAEGYFWNSGNFAFQAQVLMGQFEAFEPAIAVAARDAVAHAGAQGSVLRLDAAAFEQATKISLDYAVMEHTKLAAVVPAGFDWSDLGAWDAIWEASIRDEDGNAQHGDVIVSGARNTLVRSNGAHVAVLGASDLIVVVENDAVLIATRDRAQEVKGVVDALKAQGRSIGSRHRARHAALAEEGAARVELWRLEAGETSQLPVAQVTVLDGAVQTADGAVHGPGSRLDSEAAQTVRAQIAASLLVTLWP
jgi:mannose-1-phosphate guanylyltransferase/mannose-6-phosphate isomerase